MFERQDDNGAHWKVAVTPCGRVGINVRNGDRVGGSILSADEAYQLANWLMATADFGTVQRMRGGDES